MERAKAGWAMGRRSLWAVMIAGALIPGTMSIAGATHQAFEEPNDLGWDLAPGFGFAWDSGELAFGVTNAAASEDTAAKPVTTLRMSVRLDIPDVNGLVAMDVDNPVVFAILDEGADFVQWHGTDLDNLRRYERVGRRWIQEGYSLVERMMPSSFSLELPLDPNQAVPRTVPVIRGYVWALYADRMIEADVPFEPNDWVEPEQDSGLIICVDPTTPPRPTTPIEYEYLPTGVPRVSIRRAAAPIQVYQFTTWVKSKTGTAVMGLADSWYSPSVRASMEYVMIETQLFDSAAQVALASGAQSIMSDAGRGANCRGTLSQCEYVFDKIRHILAVDPVEVKIPFVLTDIPIPEL